MPLIFTLKFQNEGIFYPSHLKFNSLYEQSYIQKVTINNNIGVKILDSKVL